MSAPPKVDRVQGRSVSGRDASISAGNQSIPIDATWGADKPLDFPGPAELLASAFAACVLKNVERASAMMPFRYDSAEVDVKARRQDTPPKFVELEYEIRIVTSEDQRHVDLLHRNVTQFGTVFNTLAAACEVHGTVIAIAPISPDDNGGSH